MCHDGSCLQALRTRPDRLVIMILSVYWWSIQLKGVTTISTRGRVTRTDTPAIQSVNQEPRLMRYTV